MFRTLRLNKKLLGGSLGTMLRHAEKEQGMDASSPIDRRSVGLTRGTAMTFVILL